MALVLSAFVPHPPLLVPHIGGDMLKRVEATDGAMRALAARIKGLQPDVLLLATPHGPAHQTSLSLLDQNVVARFTRAPIEYKIDVDRPLQEALTAAVSAIGVGVRPCATFDTARMLPFSTGLDHALMVPLYYLQEAGLNAPVVAFSVAWADHRKHHQVGRAVRRVLDEDPRRIVVVCSGDLSHRLIPTASAGYDPKGQEFDRRIVEALKAGTSQPVLDLEDELIERAGECGLRPLGFLLGLHADAPYKSQVHSYEGPFGVGYCVCTMEP